MTLRRFRSQQVPLSAAVASVWSLGIEIADNRDWRARTQIIRISASQTCKTVSTLGTIIDHGKTSAVSVKPHGGRFPARSDAARCGRLNPDRTASED